MFAEFVGFPVLFLSISQLDADCSVLDQTFGLIVPLKAQAIFIITQRLQGLIQGHERYDDDPAVNKPLTVAHQK